MSKEEEKFYCVVVETSDKQDIYIEKVVHDYVENGYHRFVHYCKDGEKFVSSINMQKLVRITKKA